MKSFNQDGLDIAIIGMAGRFPGSDNIDEYWTNLSESIESISHLTKEELLVNGLTRKEIENPNLVGAGGILKDYDKFDASFFGYSPREAETMDPQQRVFLECAWEALENAGYNTESNTERIGVFGGTTINTYLLNNLMSQRNKLEVLGDQQTMIGNDKDYAVSRVAYKLNLKGPCVTVQGACATSLLSVHFAAQSLLNGECDIALAGGSSVRVPMEQGYIYQAGGTSAKDGHCRAFDEDATGSVPGSGVGVVVLKRLEDAISDKDCIDAVIKGTALRNDGSEKAGFTAPSVDGQARTIAESIEISGVNPEDISYVEAHGTGTSLGDPIEIAALTKAFRLKTSDSQFCRIGSVKTNIGHLDAAAGVAGLIKVVLSLKNKKLPASLNFKKPSSEIDFKNSPFFVNDKLVDWKVDNNKKRCAGINSLGMGGTNIFVLVEEAPVQETNQTTSDPAYILPLSAKTSYALDLIRKNLKNSLMKKSQLNIRDVENTLQTGRKLFNYRSALVCTSINDAIENLNCEHSPKLISGSSNSTKSVALLFPGQGSQYINMARELYEHNIKFKEIVDYCSKFLEPLLGLDLKSTLYPEQENREAKTLLNQTRITQPALFVVEYALAKVFEQINIKPKAMIGHSIGEYVSACLSGVFSLEDGLRMVAKRGELIQGLDPGLMLSISASSQEVEKLITDGLSIAAVNAPKQTVVSGSINAVKAFEDTLTEEGISYQRLHTSHAFHSEMMEPVIDTYVDFLQNFSFSKPLIPFISNLSGDYITDVQATDPYYWAQHIRKPVLFQEGVKKLLNNNNEFILLECGPSNTLSTLIKMQIAWSSSNDFILAAMKHPHTDRTDFLVLFETLSKLWVRGHDIKWENLKQKGQAQRVHLPAYPFERKRYWIDPVREERSYNDVQFKQGVELDNTEQDPSRSLSQISTTKEEYVQQKSEHYERPPLLTEYIALRNNTEKEVGRIWGEFLGIKGIGANDNFFELGGHSLLATQMVSKIRNEYQINLTMTKLFEVPTIAGLAAIIEEELSNLDDNPLEVAASSTDLDDLLKQVEEMSDDEVEKLLNDEKPLTSKGEKS